MTDVGGRPLVEARVRLVADGTGLAQDAAVEGAKAGKSAGKAAADALAKGIGDGLKEGAQKGAKPAGVELGKGLGDGVTDGVGKGLEDATAPGRLGRFRQRFRDAGERVGKAFGDGITDGQADAIDAIGDRALLAGAALGAGVAVAVKSFADFDKAISAAAAGTDTAKESMGALRDAALDAGARTAYSATEAADAITELGKAGVTTENILGGGLDASLDLAAAGQLDVARAAEIAATAMNQFGLSGRENVTEVADLLAAGAGEAQGSVEDLAQALKYVGPIAASLNVPIEDTVGLLAKLASQGILGESAGVALRTVLLNLNPTTREASVAMEELGISAFDANGQFIGVAAAMEQLSTALAPLPQQQRDAALQTIFGKEAIVGAKIAYEGGAAAAVQWRGKVEQAGYATEQAAKLMDNLSGDVEKLGGSLETVFIKGGAGTDGPLRFLVQGAEEAVNAFGALPDEVQQGTVAVAALSAGALLLGGTVAKGTIAVRRMRDDLDELGIVSERTAGRMSKIGKAAGAAGAAATALAFIPGISTGLQKSLGVVSDDLSGLTLELANFAKGAKLGAEGSKVFGSSLDGMDDFIGKTEGLKQAVNDLSGANGFFKQDIPFLPSGSASQIREISAALAGLAQKDAPTAALAFQRLAETAGLNAEESRRFLDLLPEYKSLLTETAQQQIINGEAAAGSADAASVLAGQIADAANGVDGFGSAAGSAKDQAEAMSKALEDLNNQARGTADLILGGRAAARSFEEAIDAASEAAAENGRTLDISTEAGRANQAALDDIAAAAWDNAAAILAADGTEKEYRASLERGRKEILKAAEAMGLKGKKAEELADKLLAIPTSVEIETLLKGAMQANSTFADMDYWIRRLDGSVINVGVNAPNNPFERQYRSKGGWIRGRASEVDSVPAMLAPGEFVVRSREATKPGNQRILEAMNSGRDVSASVASEAPAAGVVSSGPVASVGGTDMSEVTALLRGILAAMREQGSRPVTLNGAVVGELARAGGYTAGVEWA